MISWFWLLIAAIFEVIWATSIKYLDGIQKPVPLLINISSLVVIVITLQIAFRGLPLGIGYAAWKGCAAIGMLAVAFFVFGERFDTWTIASLSMIIIGIVGLAIKSAH